MVGGDRRLAMLRVVRPDQVTKTDEAMESSEREEHQRAQEEHAAVAP